MDIFQTKPIFVYELFETMQSSVTESKTFATKSLPASFKYCNFLLIYSKLQQNTKLLCMKLLVLTPNTKSFMHKNYYFNSYLFLFRSSFVGHS